MQITVELSRIRHNIRCIRSRLKNGFCAVVKADAYGHGAAVSPYIAPLVDCFMTATYAEAAEIVAGGVRKPVLAACDDISDAIRYPCAQIVPSVSNARDAERLIRAGCKAFSVAINTGMNRLGANERELCAIINICKRYDVRPWSVYSHIYNGISSAAEQSREFERLTDTRPLLCGRRHLFSSCALEAGGCELYDMTRCGIAMYGYADGLESALKARARIVSVSAAHRGDHIGYGDTVLDRDTTVATVRCGYADGLRRTDKPLYMTVRGEKCRVIGVPCMDLTMIDVTGVPCRTGEYAYVIFDKADAERLAAAYDTIIYEVLTGLNGRAERIYI